MRSVPGWPTSTDVLDPIFRVEHGGIAREVHSFSLTRELPSSFHAQVKGVGGITEASGSVDWASQSDVAASEPTAFNRVSNWPPKTRDAVAVWTGYRTLTGELLVKQLTGLVDSVSGNPLDPASSELVDRIARLSRKINLPPLLNSMPPLTDGGPWRGVGLYPTFFTDLAARAGGFCSTPPINSGCLFSAPLMGSAWPERGTLITGLRFSDRNNASAVWRASPWGMAAGDAYLVYTPTSGLALNSPLEVTAMFAVTAGEARFGVVWGSVGLRLRRSGTGVSAQLTTASGATTICALGNPVTDAVTMRVTPAGGSLTVELRTQDGATASGTIGRPAEIQGNASAILLESTDAGALVGGAQVALPASNDVWRSVDYTRTAFITPAAHNATLVASPPIENVPARNLLEDQSRAELAALWIDGDGALRWVNRTRLVSGGVVTTLTSKDHIQSLPWEEDFTAVAYNVEVTGRSPEAVLQSKFPVHELWQSSYGQVEADGTEVFEELIHPSSDEDWVMVDTSFDNDTAATNRLWGSDAVLYHFFQSGTAGQAGHTTKEGPERQWVGASLTRIDWRTYKLVTRVFKVSTSGWEKTEFSLKIPSERQGLAPYGWPAAYGGMSFPVVRGYAKIQWADTVHTALTGATVDAPTLSHDVGWWVQDAGAKQAIADALAANTGSPQPILRNVSIVPDARLERGDIVTLSDPEVTGLQLRCLVVGITDTFSASPLQWAQSCTFQVLATTIL